MVDRCTATAAQPSGAHVPWVLMRYPWPWGLLFPRVVRCLWCGRKVPRGRTPIIQR